ncbi:MAG: hypothetical protein ABI321_04060, partial [Polyangia bacterium]
LAELDALARVPNRAVALESALVGQGTINVGGTDDELLAAVNGRLGTETNDCAQRTIAGGTLSVTFTDPGCTLATGLIVVGGTATITIAHTDGNAQIVTHFTGTAEGEPWTGEEVISTGDGNTFSLRVLASLSGHEADIPKFSALAESSQFDITANGTEPSPVPGQDPRNLTYMGVTQFFYACHPSAGTIQLASPGENIDRTITYQSESATTNTAMYTDSSGTSTITLPTNPSCPAAAR